MRATTTAITLSAAAAMTGFLAAAPGVAAAGIRCEGSFQIVNGQPISTPFCRDANLAVVARQYGLKVSAAAIRNNPDAKLEVCRIVGRDIRVTEACASAGPLGRSQRF